MSQFRVLTFRRGSALVRRLSTNRAGPGRGSKPPGESISERLSDKSPGSSASQPDLGQEKTPGRAENPEPDYKSPLENMYKRPVPSPEEKTPLTKVSREYHQTIKATTGGHVPVEETGSRAVAAEPAGPDSTLVYHPADEEVINIADIKLPGEPRDGEDPATAEHETDKWRKIT